MLALIWFGFFLFCDVKVSCFQCLLFWVYCDLSRGILKSVPTELFEENSKYQQDSTPIETFGRAREKDVNKVYVRRTYESIQLAEMI
jgi:hypothetical protein